MAFIDEISQFNENHKFVNKDIDGINTKYLLCGNEAAEDTLVYLVGGAGYSEVWFKHILKMEQDYRILTFDYPMEIDDLEKLADHIMKLIHKLGVKKPVLIGASLGGFMAQIIARRYADEIRAVLLYATCSLSEQSVEDLKKQYKSYGVMLKLMKIVPYSWIKKILFAFSKKQVGMENEKDEDKVYMTDFFAWLYSQYTKEFDLHMTGLIADVANLKPFVFSDYEKFDFKSLLVLPDGDVAFSEKAKQDLLDSMPKAKVVSVKGGHTATIYKVDDYVNASRNFLVNI
ncbi:MAG: alpha/beta hydrolase [Eubacteriales bacterium]|nr:alpha/beta hydrolase [Eubacteriales bacterium]